jgi:hypothetical protein
MNTLVAQAEFLSDLAQRPSGQLELAYRLVEVGAGELGVALSDDGAGFRGSRLI